MLIESHIDIRYPDCDPMGIVHHAVYPLWFEIGRLDFLSAAGYGYMSMNREGINPTMVDLHIQYHSPVRFPGKVTVRTSCSLCQGKKLELRYAAYQGENPHPVATASSFHIWTGSDITPLDMSTKPEIYRKLTAAAEQFGVLILAGGRSTRMGSDKAAITLDGTPLLLRAIRFWQTVCPGTPIYVSAGQPDHVLSLPDGITPIYDQVTDCGPMGGLQAAFRQCKQELLWVSAVDMPLLSSQAVALLSDKRCHCEDACVFTHDGRLEPLLGLYRSTCLPVMDKLLETGEHRMSALLHTVRTTQVPLKNMDWVRNVNTPQELTMLRQEQHNG